MDLERERILNGTIVGFEFEMYSNLSREEIAKQLGPIIKKKIIVSKVYHSKHKDSFRVEPDFSGGVKMNELITTPMPYREAIAVLSKITSWMRDSGTWTDEKCACHINISFDEFKLKLKSPMEAVNRLKFVLGFDEKFVYDRFPKRENSIYARSINSIMPVNKFVFNDDVDYVHAENYELPSDKNYGINFSKLVDGYLEVRYCGGRNYEKKLPDLIAITDYVAIFTHNVLQFNQQYTDTELSRLRNVLKEHKKVVASFSDMEMFFYNYPNIRLFVDLKGEKEIIKTFFPVLRERLFDLIVECGMRKGTVNYDADVGKYQIKDAVIAKAFPLRGLEVFSSKLQGNVVECDLYSCVITNAHVIDSNLFRGNVVQRTKLINSPLHSYNEVHNSYIDNRDNVINCTVEGGIIRSGEIGPLAKISPETEIINATGDGKGGKWGEKFGDKGDKKDGKSGRPGYQGWTELGKDKDGIPSSAGKTNLGIVYTGGKKDKDGKATAQPSTDGHITVGIEKDK